MSWTDIPDSVLEIDKPVRSIDIVALRDNDIALAEGDTHASILIRPLVLLDEEVVSSAVAQVDLSVAAGYREYRLAYDRVVPVTNAVNCFARLGVGGVIDTGASSYEYVATRTNTGAASSLSGSTGISLMYLDGVIGISNNAEFGISGEMVLYDLSATGVRKRGIVDSTLKTGTSVTYDIRGVNWGISANLRDNAVDTVRVAMSSGNIASGRLRLFGRK